MQLSATNGAHRAALLFSYLEFLTVVKERLLAAKKPTLFEQGNWDAIIKPLSYDEKWEAVAFEATQRPIVTNPVTRIKTRDAVFSISDQLRRQISYWRDRRNDCAHYKDNEINDFHVETFWSFLKSNLAKITVEGGVASLLAKFAQHYDPAFTAADTDVMPLVLEITTAVDTTSLPDFWIKLEQVVRYTGFGIGDFHDIIDKVLALNDNRITSSLVNFIKGSEHRLARYLTHKPTFIGSLNFDASEIRNFWHTNLWLSQGCFNIYSVLLSLNLIPETQIEEANTTALSQIKGKPYVSELVMHLVLKEKGFTSLVEQTIFAAHQIRQYMWTNERYEFLSGFVEMSTLTDEIVTEICTAFSRSEYSYYLSSALNRVFEQNLAKNLEFRAIATRLGLTLPSRISALTN